MYDSGKPKRERGPLPARKNNRIFLVSIVMVLILAMVIAAIALILTDRHSIPYIELTVTTFSIDPTTYALLHSTQTAVARQSMTQTAAFPTASSPSSTPVSTFSDLDCTWIVSTRADPNGWTPYVQEQLDQALLPAPVRVMVDECLNQREVILPT